MDVAWTLNLYFDLDCWGSDVALADNWNDFSCACKAFGIILADNWNDFLNSIYVTVTSTDGLSKIVYVAKTLHI